MANRIDELLAGADTALKRLQQEEDPTKRAEWIQMSQALSLMAQTEVLRQISTYLITLQRPRSD